MEVSLRKGSSRCRRLVRKNLSLKCFLGIVNNPGTDVPIAGGIYLNMSAQSLKDGSSIALLRDVTEIRQREEQLRLNEERYANATSFLIVYEWDGETKTFDINAGANSGTENRDDVSEGGAYLDRVHPDDREAYRSEFILYLKNEIESFDVEYRRKTDMEAPYRWCRDRATAIRDKSGKTLKLYGVIEDIEEAKGMQADLEKERGRQQAIFEGFGFTAYDWDGETNQYTFLRYGD